MKLSNNSRAWLLAPLMLCALWIEPVFSATSLVFPQLADGGGYRSTFLMTHSNLQSAAIQIDFFGSDGTPLEMPILGKIASSHSFSLPPQGSLKVDTDGTGNPAKVGWAVLTSSSDRISGHLIFRYFRSGTLVSEASVMPSPMTAHSEFYIDESPGFHTGVAIANPGPDTVRFRLNAYDASGKRAGTYSSSLGPQGHLSKFLYEMLPNLPSGRAEWVVENGTLALISLRFSATSTFTTVSVNSLLTKVEDLIGYVGSPAHNSTYAGNEEIEFNGWALARNGIGHVDILVEKGTANWVIVGQAEIHLSRPDILALYPTFANPNAGFAYRTNVRRLLDIVAGPGNWISYLNAAVRAYDNRGDWIFADLRLNFIHP